jgi:hypothetical protein
MGWVVSWQGWQKRRKWRHSPVVWRATTALSIDSDVPPSSFASIRIHPELSVGFISTECQDFYYNKQYFGIGTQTRNVCRLYGYDYCITTECQLSMLDERYDTFLSKDDRPIKHIIIHQLLLRSSKQHQTNYHCCNSSSSWSSLAFLGMKKIVRNEFGYDDLDVKTLERIERTKRRDNFDCDGDEGKGGQRWWQHE